MDSFSNQLARIGFGTPSLLESTEYPLTRLTRNYILMQSLYRSHWMIRKMIDAPAEDMMKHWVELVTEVSPQQETGFKEAVRRTQTQDAILRTLKWGRLFGGAGALMIIKGHESILNEPLDLDEVELDSYRGLLVFDRWSGVSPNARICSDIDRPVDFNLPEHYQVTTQTGQTFNIHSSRLLRFIGRDIPWWEKAVEQYWGISEIEVVFDELKKRDNTSWNIAALVFRANIFAMKNKDLAQMLSGISTNAAAQTRLYQTMQAQNHLMSNQGMMVLPEEGGLETHAYSFAGIAEVYEAFKEDFCGAADIPYPRMFGRSPGGLSATGEDGLQNYYDSIDQKREREVGPQLDKLMPVIAMSTWGEVPNDLDYRFPPTRTLNDEQRSKLGTARTTAANETYNSGIVGRKTVLKELKEQSPVDGFWTNITDKMIEEADDDVMSQTELALETAQQAEPGSEGEDSGT